MTRSQELQIKSARLRQSINEMPVEFRADDPKVAVKKALVLELSRLDGRLATALEEEAKELNGANFSNENSEHRELIRRASAAEVITAVAEHRLAGGATGELQRELGIGSDVVPWALLEHRAAATFTAGTGEAGTPFYVGRPFADSIAEFVGCRVVQVPTGESDYPVLSTGASVGHLTDSSAQAESTAVFTVEKLTPRNRYQASFSVREQDLIAFAGAGAAVTEELRAAVRDALDKDLLTRAGEGLLTVKADAEPGTPGAASTAAAMIGELYTAVDGLYASDVRQCRMVVGAGATGTYQYMGKTASGVGGDASVAEKIQAVSGGLRVSPHIPDYGSNHQEGIVCAVGDGPNAVMALFGGGVRVLEDPYTRAEHGERRFIGRLFGDFSILRAGAYHRFRVRTS